MSTIPYSFLGSFIVSVFLLQWWQLPSYPWWLWTTLACLATGSRRPIVSATAIGLAFSLIAVGRAVATPRPIEAWADGAVTTIEGMIDRAPDERVGTMQYALDVRRLRRGTGTWIAVSDRILVTDRNVRARVLPGELVRVSGKLSLAADDPDFSYRAYLALQGLHAILDARAIDPLLCTDEHRLQRTLHAGRMAFERRIAAVFPEPSAALLAGLLTGSRRGLPEHITEDFRRTGLSHIVAVSGSNITVVLSVIGRLLFFLPLKWRFVPSIFGVSAFALFAGGSASVVRAAIMGIIGLAAIQTDNLPHVRLATLWTAFFMLLWNPMQFWFDAGFQLSFLAVLGIVECRTLIEPLLRKMPDVLGAREALLTTLCAQVTTTPWIAVKFGLFSLIAPVANLLASPFIPASMMAGAIGTAAGLAHPLLGRIIGLPAQFLLETIVSIATTMSALPFAAFEVTRLSNVFLVAYYVALLILLRRMKKAATSAA